MTVPLVRATAVGPGSGSRKAESDRRRLRILVADDNRDSTDGCAMLLQMSGHDVRTAYSGTEALAVAVEFIPEIALLDIGMPGMNGYEVAREIRATPWGAGVMLVAVTGWGQVEDKRLAEAAGFDRHFAKPLDLDVLQPLLAQCSDADR